MSKVEETLKERGKNYGSFSGQAFITQKLEASFWNHYDTLRGENAGIKVYPFIREALHQIFHKLGRLANGDITHPDSWLDIAGYAQLAEKDCLSIVKDRADTAKQMFVESNDSYHRANAIQSKIKGNNG